MYFDHPAPKGIRDLACQGGLNPERLRLLWRLTSCDGSILQGAFHDDAIEVSSGWCLNGIYPSAAPPKGMGFKIGTKYVTPRWSRRFRGAHLQLAWVDFAEPNLDQISVFDRVLQ